MIARDDILNRPNNLPKMRARDFRLKTVPIRAFSHRDILSGHTEWVARNKFGTYLGNDGRLTKNDCDAISFVSRKALRAALARYREEKNSIL